MSARGAEETIRAVTRVSELNKQKVRLFVEVVLNEGRLELIDELLAADYLGRIPCAPGQVVGRDELRRLVLDHRLIHPGLCIKIEEEIAEDDLVMMRWRSGATAPGRTAMGGSPQCWLGISVIRLLAGRQVDAYTAIAASATQAAP